MTRNAHRVRWIGRADVQGRWCHAPGCHEYARLDARTLIAHHLLTEDD